ncbi:atos homolog protein A-like [Macrosteles quadrilineatus]|uniref:atos homolog protein A-like n=1 Tax=Macrosteles quadrilineatus TaxID=74068 RepID=UPI0023E10E24|nr:atos homolog protein A-like [Macrosteles quadrilineatus]
MHCSRMEDGVEAFVELGTLIVEGRLPAEGTARGYNEGPHCPRAPPTPQLNPHQCDPADFLCMRAERLRKHLSLLCNNAVPMCVEVLLCPLCPCGTERARSPEVANIPSSSDLLLEQWTVSVVHISDEPCNMSMRSLLQAVRSQLHFSQLSAWWSSSRGSRPINVCYRVTLPERAFVSHFSRPPQHHIFPPAAVGPNTQLKVSVRTLPRSDVPPVVACASCTPDNNVRKRSIGLEQPLLGESLLDPPGPSSASRAHAGLCKWHTGSPPSPPRRRPSRQVMTRRCDKHTSSLHILPLPGPVDDRMQTDCNQHGKHDCRCEEDVEEPNSQARNKLNLELSKKEMEEVLTVLRVRVGTEPDNITVKQEKVSGKGDLLMSAILRSSQLSPPSPVSLKRKLDQDIDFIPPGQLPQPDSKTSLDFSNKNNIEILPCDKSKDKTKKEKCTPPLELELDKSTEENVLPPHSGSGDWFGHSTNASFTQDDKCGGGDVATGPSSIVCELVNRYRTKQCVKKEDKEELKCQQVNNCLVEEFSNLDLNKRVETPQVPSALDKAKFRRSLDSAASMVFHWRTGLPLTSSPAPLRRTSQRFDFDSSINSVSSIRSALFDLENGEDTESDSSKSPCSPQIDIPSTGEPWSFHYQSPGSALLGSFEESVLNGRLEPVSTVHGFTADLGASGSFCPPHLVLPVTVFFYTLGDNDKVSTPYLAHINLGKKGYVVPRSGTIQVTLLNPLGTVIKMFVVMYNLTDMPSNSHTFLRQRTLYMPAGLSEPVKNSQKYLRYLIHLRFASSKSGRLTLHTDIRMIIFRKSDMDTASGHTADTACEMRSFTYGPTNPKFSPRK